MKYGKKHFFGYVGLILSLVLLSACGSQGVKQTSAEAELAPELLPTLEFIPSLESDKEGNLLAYEAKLNPYIKRGRIKKSSVQEFIRARRSFSQGKASAAEKILNDLVLKDKSLSGPWVMLAEIALKQNDRASAQEHLSRALEVNGDNMNAWLRLAYVQRLEGNYVLAQNTYAGALQTWRDCPEAHLNLAVLYDVYLNLPLRAQRHMEAYMFLSGGNNQQVAEWLEEIQERTGAVTSLPADKALLKPVS